MLQNFVHLTCDLYLVYSFLYRNDMKFILGNQLFTRVRRICINYNYNDFIFSELLLQLCPTTLILLIVLSACEKCLEEVRHIGFLLHNIEKNVDEEKINTLTENFSLQILHEPLMFSVSGFFQMDFMFLKTIVSSITTYMVIFIQFMPKDTNENNNVNSTKTLTTTELTTTVKV